MIAPAFWVRYRGNNDPQIPITRTYNYAATFLGPNNVVLFSGSRNVLGPPQLTKNDYIEINWTVPPGLIQVIMNRGGNTFYQSNGASGGLRDDGQFIISSGEPQQ